MDSDLALARALQAQFDEEDAHEEVSSFIPEQFRFGSPAKKIRPVSENAPETSIIAPEWEDLDPTPDLHALFLQFNTKFFWGKLLSCEVKWSPRMTSCAGVCSYQRRSGYCSIRLSVPLLKLRPRKDLVETLLHEMIHAYLFVTDGDDDHDGHGPAFHKHMYRINGEAGTKISVYHSFHDEVAVYQQHWWKCSGPCQKRPPFYGMVKRSMNRAPGPYDRWWNQHQANCGGTYTKVKEPEGFGQKKSKGTSSKEQPALKKGQKDIRSFVNGSSSSQSSSSSSQSGSSSSQGGPNINGFSNPGTSGSSSKGSSGGGGGAKGNIFGFGGTSFSSPGSSGGGLKTKGRTGTMVVGPHSKVSDNSSGGQVVSTPDNDSSTIGGFRVGTGLPASQGAVARTETEASPGAVRQTLRDFWGSKFDGKTSSVPSKSSGVKSGSSSSQQSSQSTSLPKSKSDEKSSPAKAKCPVCSAEVAESEINNHLDECLQSPPPETSTKPSSNPFVDDDDSKPCPVCGKEVLIQEMNDHLDFCMDATS